MQLSIMKINADHVENLFVGRKWVVNIRNCVQTCYEVCSGHFQLCAFKKILINMLLLSVYTDSWDTLFSRLFPRTKEMFFFCSKEFFPCLI